MEIIMTLVKTAGGDLSHSGNSSLTTAKPDYSLHPISGLFKEHSGRAFDIQTQRQIHPHNSIQGCVAAFAGKLENGQSVILIESDPSATSIKNWNKGTSTTSYIEGRAALADENPDLFKKVASVTGCQFKPDAIIWLDKMIPTDENALAPPENALLPP
jgi:hypothetical protein